MQWDGMAMTSNDLTRLDLVDVSALLRARAVTARDVAEACLARLRGVGRDLGAVVAVDEGIVLAAAEQADSLARDGRPLGPLHGVPLAHKYMFYRQGRISGCGSRIRADFVPTYTATVLERLDCAGALDIARLNMSEFALGATGHNDITGTPRNPWNQNHVPGGSSSGPAFAVAAGLVYASLGSDTGGSIRQPSAFCGVVGLKPTYGRVSRHGVMPLSFTLDHVGPIARSARDCAVILQAIAGHDAADLTSSTEPVPAYSDGLDGDIRGVRIAVPETYFYDSIDPQIRTCVEESLAVYRSLGARIVNIFVPSLDVANRMASLIAAVEGAALHHRWLETQADDYGPQTRARLLRGLDERATDYVEALRLRGQILAEFGKTVFAQADVLHTPTMPMEAPAITASDVGDNSDFMNYVQRFGHCTRPINYLGLPAISVPAGLTEDGLPSAFQLVARPFDEARLLTLAHAYETAVYRTWRDTPMKAWTTTGETNRQDGTRSAA